mmetsp:Transcript_1049/g.3541  ORF Transcript_1049/g.3541 Transcript_1049/m.3541 type:complete len:1393 (-) Transcript_1049:213-4391(-)
MTAVIPGFYEPLRPPRREQVDELGDLLEKKPQDGTPGDEWAVIPFGWLKKWKKYANYTSPGEEPADAGAMSMLPDSINTKSIVKNNSEWGDLTVDLKRDVEVGKNIAVVPKDAFDLFVKWFDLSRFSKPIWREVSTIDGVTDIELHPLTFKVNVCGHDGEPRSKTKIQVSRVLPVTELMERAAKEVAKEAFDEKEPLKIWFENDSKAWEVMGTRTADVTEVKNADHKVVRDLPKAVTSLHLGVMVEEQDDGAWRRSEESRAGMIAAIKARRMEVNAMTSEEWLAQLSPGDFCDHYDAGEEEKKEEEKKEDGEEKVKEDVDPNVEEKPPRRAGWREASVLEMHDDGTITIAWRGVPGHSVRLPKDSDLIAKTFSKARDWRNQLKVKNLVEIHIDNLALSDGKRPDEVAPVYRRGSVYIYYIPSRGEWWIGDWIRQRHGYITQTMEGEPGDPKHLDILNLPTDKWTFYDAHAINRASYTRGGWLPMEDPMLIKMHKPSAIPGDYPEEIEISGHDDYQRGKMGIWKRTSWIMAEVTRIDRVQGKIDVALRQHTKASMFAEPPKATDHIKGIDLYGDKLVEHPTHLQLKATAKAGYRSHYNFAPVEKGACGLENLGNTCYMNSILQCMNAATPLQELFVEPKKVEAVLNTANVIGTGGVLARAYSDLVESMWSGKDGVLSPAEFKLALGNAGPQFANNLQHDAVEMFDLTIDNLHEDVNRIIDKPQTEPVEDDGRDDEVLAKESWMRYKLRNDSMVVDTLGGMFRSHLTCPDCATESRKFDPFFLVNLPLPHQASRRLKVHIIMMDPSQPAIEVIAAIETGATTRGLTDKICAELPKEAGLDAGNVVLVELLHRGTLYKTLYSPRWDVSDHEPVEGIMDSDELWAYEVPRQDIKGDPSADEGAREVDEDDFGGYGTMRDNQRFFSAHRGLVLGDDWNGMPMMVHQKTLNARPRYTSDAFEGRGPPRFNFPFRQDMTCKEVHHMLWEWAKVGLPTPEAVDPVKDVYDHHPSAKYGPIEDGTYVDINGVYDPRRPIPPPPITEMVEVDADGGDEPPAAAKGKEEGPDDDEAKVDASVGTTGVTISVDEDDDTTEDPVNLGPPRDGRPAYVVVLTEEDSETATSARALRDGGPNHDITLPLQTLPYSDMTLGELGQLRAKSLGLMVAFDMRDHVGDLIVKKKGDEAEGDVPTLDDCMQLFATREKLGMFDSWRCPKCRTDVEAFKKMDIWAAPPLLVLSLKRFQVDLMTETRRKIEGRINYPEFLELDPYVVGPQKGAEDMLYELVSVSNHRGDAAGGHYTAYGKVHGRWYNFDDSSVNEVPARRVLHNPAAYVLFYRKLSPEEVKEHRANPPKPGAELDEGSDEPERTVSLGSSAAADEMDDERMRDFDKDGYETLEL